MGARESAAIRFPMGTTATVRDWAAFHDYYQALHRIALDFTDAAGSWKNETMDASGRAAAVRVSIKRALRELATVRFIAIATDETRLAAPCFCPEARELAQLEALHAAASALIQKDILAMMMDPLWVNDFNRILSWLVWSSHAIMEGDTTPCIDDWDHDPKRHHAILRTASSDR